MLNISIGIIILVLLTNLSVCILINKIWKLNCKVIELENRIEELEEES